MIYLYQTLVKDKHLDYNVERKKWFPQKIEEFLKKHGSEIFKEHVRLG